VCMDIFDRWQDCHARAQVRQSFCTSGHTNRWEISLSVALDPRWPKPWNVSNTRGRRVSGKYGRGVFVDVSHCRVTSVPGTWIFSSRRALIPCKRLASSASVACASAKASGETDVQTASTRNRASATMFSCPESWLMSVVNCDMKSRWLNCRGLHLSRFG
jgi:hypothetical protein